MTAGIKTIIYPVKDIARAKPLYSAWLGAEPYADAPHYNVDGRDIGLDPNGHSKGMTGPVSYMHVDDIRAGRQTLLNAGADEQQAISDVGGGRLTATVKDADGNIVGLIQDLK